METADGLFSEARIIPHTTTIISSHMAMHQTQCSSRPLIPHQMPRKPSLCRLSGSHWKCQAFHSGMPSLCVWKNTVRKKCPPCRIQHPVSLLQHLSSPISPQFRQRNKTISPHTWWCISPYLKERSNDARCSQLVKQTRHTSTILARSHQPQYLSMTERSPWSGATGDKLAGLGEKSWI